MNSDKTKEEILERYRDDPKDLRDLTLEQLEREGNRMGSQFNEWDKLFNVESAIRCHGQGRISELLKWCIYSNRWLILDKENMTDYKLFPKEDVIRLIKEAYNKGFQDAKFNDFDKQHEGEMSCVQSMDRQL